MRHLLEVRREIRPIPEQVRVVELQVDDVFDLRAVTIELAAFLPFGRRSCAGAGLRDAAGGNGGERERNHDRARDLQASTHFSLLLDDHGTLRLPDRGWES